MSHAKRTAHPSPEVLIATPDTETLASHDRVGFARAQFEDSLKSLSRMDSGWRLTLYPDAAEAGGWFQSALRRTPSFVSAGFAADPVRSAEEAGRRARGKVRRYCAANGLNRLGTLTFRGEGCHDPQRVREHLGEFFREIRTLTGGEPLPYLWTPELHKTHGLHAHFAVGRFISRTILTQAWRHGFVHIKLLGNLPVGSGGLAEARAAAGYLSKYIGKGYSNPTSRVFGMHRYDLAQGFTPRGIPLSGRSAAEVLDLASSKLGSDPTFTWSSASVEDWQGPSAIWAQWGS